MKKTGKTIPIKISGPLNIQVIVPTGDEQKENTEIEEALKIILPKK